MYASECSGNALSITPAYVDPWSCEGGELVLCRGEGGGGGALWKQVTHVLLYLSVKWTMQSSWIGYYDFVKSSTEFFAHFHFEVNVDSRDNVGGWGYKINVFSHFGHDLSSPGLTLVPTGIIKPRNLLKMLSKRERRQTNGYRMRFIVNFNQKMTMWQFGIILPLILPIPLETKTTEIKMGNAFKSIQDMGFWHTHMHTHILQ